MAATISDKVRSRPVAISLSPFQKASSRLTLVLWPAMTIERLTTGDFITPSVFRSRKLRGAHRTALEIARPRPRKSQQPSDRSRAFIGSFLYFEDLSDPHP